MPANLETPQWPQDWKRSVFTPIPKKGNAKECSNYRTVALISHGSKAVLKILQARLQLYIHQLLDVPAGFRKGKGTRDQIANIHWIIEKMRELKIYICFIDHTKTFDCVDHNKLLKILEEMGILDHLTCLRNLCTGQEATDKTGHGTMQGSGPKSGKEYIKVIYCHPAYLISVQGTSCKMLGWMKHKLESRLLGEI